MRKWISGDEWKKKAIRSISTIKELEKQIMWWKKYRIFHPQLIAKCQTTDIPFHVIRSHELIAHDIRTRESLIFHIQNISEVKINCNHHRSYVSVASLPGYTGWLAKGKVTKNAEKRQRT